MNPNVCPCCNRTLRARKSKSADPIAAVDTSQMSTRELFAYYKRTAPIEDVRFFATRAVMSDDLAADARELLEAVTAAPMPRAEIFRRLTALQDRWRHEHAIADLAESLAEHAANGEVLIRGYWTRAQVEPAGQPAESVAA